ncbi:MAG: hypothetical protein Q4B26_03270 [Eubacteriales bacterium]|nr:hypothetical protein [Eubacteriales bacterium]
MTKQKRFIPKGDYGYISSEKKKRLLITAGLFVLPLTVFFAAWVVNGTRNNVLTVLAIVGCLPGCRSMVNYIMLLRCKSMNRELYQEIKKHQGNLVMAWEMYMTFYEKSAAVDAFAICGNTVVGYSSDPKIDAKYMASNAQKLVRKNGYKVDVKILTELKPFLERLDSMNEHKESLEEGIKFVPDNRYPDLSRNELIKHTLLALCL